jgi:flagellar protein FlaF
MFSSARQAYDQGTKTSQSSRDLEANALFKAARMLEACRQNWSAPDRPARLEEALAYQQKLWSFFQSELSTPNHPLPAELRSWLLSLSLFMDRRVMEIRANPEPEGLDALIRINREIALGLSTRPGESGGAAPSSQAA